MVTHELWERVYQREGGVCVASMLDPKASPCRNKWGERVSLDRYGRMSRSALTYAHIKMAPGGPRLDDERHAVMCCWHHHVMGRGADSMWITSKRGLGLTRAYLRGLYGDDYQ